MHSPGNSRRTAERVFLAFHFSSSPELLPHPFADRYATRALRVHDYIRAVWVTKNVPWALGRERERMLRRGRGWGREWASWQSRKERCPKKLEAVAGKWGQRTSCDSHCTVRGQEETTAQRRESMTNHWSTFKAFIRSFSVSNSLTACPSRIRRDRRTLKKDYAKNDKEKRREVCQYSLWIRFQESPLSERKFDMQQEHKGILVRNRTYPYQNAVELLLQKAFFCSTCLSSTYVTLAQIKFNLCIPNWILHLALSSESSEEWKETEETMHEHVIYENAASASLGTWLSQHHLMVVDKFHCWRAWEKRAFLLLAFSYTPDRSSHFTDQEVRERRAFRPSRRCQPPRNSRGHPIALTVHLHGHQRLLSDRPRMRRRRLSRLVRQSGRWWVISDAFCSVVIITECTRGHITPTLPCSAPTAVNVLSRRTYVHFKPPLLLRRRPPSEDRRGGCGRRGRLRRQRWRRR